MKLLITGITGLIGQHLREECRKRGHTIHYLTTDRAKIEDLPDYKGFYWNLKEGTIDKDCLVGVDKIIHLAGAPVAKRWTSKHKKEIIESRVVSARLLRELLEEHPNQVTQFISASAIGVYPDSLHELYDENTTNLGEDFLGKVVEQWEESADAFKKLGLLVSKIRIGLVLSREGGLLVELAKPIKWGLGSCLGSGRQWQSWIHIRDLVHLFLHVTEAETPGVFNAVAPNPVHQKNLLKGIAQHLKKPLFLPPVPKFALRLLLGEMAEMVTSSQLVVNNSLGAHDFEFRYPHLEKALDDLLGAG